MQYQGLSGPSLQLWSPREWEGVCSDEGTSHPEMGEAWPKGQLGKEGNTGD